MGKGEESVRTGHLNQLRGYILDSEFDGERIGALLYPMVNNDLKKGKVLSLYRLTLGQARQEELLDYIYKEFDDVEELKKLFIDLSPFSKIGEE